ncbi:hypothetical protein DsansV1_C26g0195031 [Dioscorea sansibarensis]
MVSKFVACDVHAHDNSHMFDVNLLKKLIRVSSGRGSDKALLKKMFDHFGTMWVDMKSHNKDKEENDAQYFKFQRSLWVDLTSLITAVLFCREVYCWIGENYWCFLIRMKTKHSRGMI